MIYKYNKFEFYLKKILAHDRWKKIHDTVNSIECEFCRDKGIKLMRGIHDAVSIHIGKTPQYPKDLKFTEKYTDYNIYIYYQWSKTPLSIINSNSEL